MCRDKFGNYEKWLIAAVCLVFFMFSGLGGRYVVSAASTGKYGILVSASNGKYTWYDLTGEKGTQRIEVSSNGTVMIPLKKVCSYMTAITYKFSYDTMSATLTNSKNGKKVIVKKGSVYATVYTSKNAKAKKVKLSSKTYLSLDSNACMADQKVLKYVFSKTTGYHFYNKSVSSAAKKIAAAGYNGNALKGLILYNPYKSVTSIPSSTAINYVSEKDLSNIVKVTVPEGYSAAQIGNLMVSMGVCQSTSAFLAACNSVDTDDYWFLDGVKKSSQRCFLVEGYLYPSTYELYKNTSPSAVVSKLLANAGKQLDSQDQERAEELGYTLDQVMAMASILEKEVSNSAEITTVSSVLHNRLSQNMKLQCDATINYIEKYVKPYITGNIDRYNSYYNTYKCSALPAGPICNPGKTAIQAALYPGENNYLYFCADSQGTYYYAATYEEHLENVKKCQ